MTSSWSVVPASVSMLDLLVSDSGFSLLEVLRLQEIDDEADQPHDLSEQAVLAAGAEG